MSNYKAQMSNQAQNPNNKKNYDLEERTAKFGEDIIEFSRKLEEMRSTNLLSANLCVQVPV